MQAKSRLKLIFGRPDDLLLFMHWCKSESERERERFSNPVYMHVRPVPWKLQIKKNKNKNISSRMYKPPRSKVRFCNTQYYFWHRTSYTRTDFVEVFLHDKWSFFHFLSISSWCKTFIIVIEKMDGLLNNK